MSSADYPPAIPEPPTTSDEPLHVEILLPSGAKQKYDLSLATTIGEIKQKLITDWPAEFGAKIDDVERLRFLYMGAFIVDARTLASLPNRTERILFHLNIRPSAQEIQQEHDLDKKAMKQTSGGCCVMS